MSALTYYVQLVALDDQLARFATGPHMVTVNLPTEAWVDLGRPGQIQVTPTPYEVTP